ncbi:uncharacterized protein LOC109428822 [Rhizophagus clarus]|uniref:Uncharacterized protein LOC109428822 n=1 Tax=Rhizophagus clarus TaxID=94130 RepID=A0A8H3MBY0_9GLOM|nr:uncharacterized protein LOC109428822 [Rhizophagus clarus]
MQTFLTTPKYNKFHIYKTPTSQYQRFCNAFGYHCMEIQHKSQEEIENKIKEYLATKVPIQADTTPPPNAAAQKKTAEVINATNTKLAEVQQIYNTTANLEIQNNLAEHMAALKQVLQDENNKNNEVVQYDTPDHLSFLFQYPDLHEHINECIEFGAADKKRKKKSLKNKHIDEHYCFASVKGAKQFTVLFPTHSVIIFQNDKSKVSLVFMQLEEHFRPYKVFKNWLHYLITIFQSAIGMQQKLIPSVYLLINPSDKNDTFRNGQLSIYIRLQYQVGTSSEIHMNDLDLLTQDSHFDGILKVNSQIKPIWILLVNRGPDKKLRYIKNIHQYCRMFQAFDLDYLSIQTHAPGQSLYNPVEHSMVTLSQKLASIALPINKFSSHLNSQGQVVDLELAMKTFVMLSSSFDNVIFSGSEKEDINESGVPWQWLENHTKMCQYSLDIKKCNDHSCCSPNHYEETTILLIENDDFLLPVTKGKDGHYLNLLHILEYFDKLKIPEYDAHYPSINTNTYNYFCCSESKKRVFTNSVDDFSVAPACNVQVLIINDWEVLSKGE